MVLCSDPPESRAAATVLFTLLPGPTRKRSASLYGYRLTYRSADLAVPGCMMTWEVSGGRLLYQIALERDDSGHLHLHCTCADAVFRAEPEGRPCKHLHGLLDFGRSTRAPFPTRAETMQGQPGDLLPEPDV
jgi:hypothetical protein